MLRTSSLLSSWLLAAVAGGAAAPRPDPGIFDSSAPVTAAGQLDKLVLAKLSSLGIKPVLCSDVVFVRRAYLDVIGTVPTGQEARDFIQDPDTKNKRRALVERLLVRDEFAEYWSMRWGDILRIKAEFPVNLWPNAAQAYHRWVYAALAENKPYDQFARELLTSSGSNFRVGPVNFYRAVQNRTPEGIAGAVALTFMGARTDSWPAERLGGMAAFFSQIGYKPTNEWKEENVFWDPLHASLIASNIAPGQAAIGQTAPPENDSAAEETKPAKPAAPAFPDGTKAKLNPNRDPREAFADWLITPKNPWFAKSIVNRVWWWLMGRGIVHEPDDIRDDNPPSNPALLEYLEKELVAGNYDLKKLYRVILNSNTYQFSSVPRFKSAQAEAQFAAYPLRRLDAEVLIDSINKITGTKDLYTSAIPEPFTYIPDDLTAVAIADGSITSPFLTLFGRSARATGMENERSNKPVSGQWLHMLNSSHIQRKLENSPKLRTILESGKKPPQVVEELYLAILSRPPTPEEVQHAMEYGNFATPLATVKSGKTVKPDKEAWAKRHDNWVDIAWALVNSTEFLYRH